MEKGSGTRSGMLWEVERLLQEGARPQILLMENVPEVIGNKNISAFADWVSSLEKMGYTSKWKIMNATEYKVPQNRRRCFMVSWLGDYYYQFPPAQKLEIRLKNILQKDVDEKYYIQGKAEMDDAIQTTDKEGVVDGCVMIGRLTGGYFDSYDMISRVYSVEASCPSLHANQGGGNEIKIARAVGGIGEKKSNGGTQFYQQDRVYDGDIALAKSADLPGGSYKYLQDFRVRKLTEREVFRLQGVKDEDFEKVATSISKSLLYHLAGDSIEVSCLMAIFGMMLDVDWKSKIDDLIEDICELYELPANRNQK